MRFAIALVVLAGLSATAASDSARKTTAQTTAKTTKKRAVPKKRESTAVSRNHHFAADNMPAGWQWPPTKAMIEQEKGCEAKLDESGVTWTPGQGDGRIVDAVALAGHAIGGISFVGYSSSTPVMDCQLALAFAKLAPTLYSLGVREIHFGSIFRWTKVRAFGRTENMLSRHSIGIAMDVVSFVDDTGREAVVGRDYRKDDALLLSVEQAVNASGLFRILLTPKNDPKSHSDHFHIETNIDFTPPDLAASE